MEIISTISKILETKGVHATLKYLNARTPHRFTGIYRYDGEILRNVCLFDQFNPTVTMGQDVAMEDAYCANVGLGDAGIEFNDIKINPKIAVKSGSPVISYCGALMRDNSGKPYGTLCHYDIKPCDTPVSDLPLLEKIAPMVYRSLLREGAPVEAGAIIDYNKKKLQLE